MKLKKLKSKLTKLFLSGSENSLELNYCGETEIYFTYKEKFFMVIEEKGENYKDSPFILVIDSKENWLKNDLVENLMDMEEIKKTGLCYSDVPQMERSYKTLNELISNNKRFLPI